MKNQLITTKIITRTAMLLALAIIFQNLRILPILAPATPQSTFVIGSLVNLVLYVASVYTGLFGGLVIGLCTPIVALMQGHIKLPILIPVVFLGNALLFVIFYYVRKINVVLGVVVASLVKWAFLAIATTWGLKLFGVTLPKAAAALFNTPQLITALIGGTIAIFVLMYLKKANNKEQLN